MHTRDPKIGVKRSTRLAAKRDKMVSVAALLDHAMGKKEEREQKILLFGGQVRKVEGKMIGRPIRKEREHLQRMEEKPSLKREEEDSESTYS